MEFIVQDIRYAVRSLRKSPGFTIAAILALALGIGANTAMFSVVYGVLLRSLPYKNADRTVVFNTSIPDYREIKASAKSFEQMAVWASNLYSSPRPENSEEVLGATVSPEFFPMLGEAALGRTIRPEEDHDFVAVLSHPFWVSHFNSDPNVTGKSLRLNNQLYTVVGVMPPSFRYPSADFKIWVPFGSTMDAAPEQANNRTLRIFRVVAQLAPGVSMQAAQAEMDALSQRIEKENSKTNEGVRVQLTPLYQRIIGDVRPALLALFGAVGFILLIACANVANLLLARVSQRRREITMRTALGASRARILRQLLSESMLLSLTGSGLGVLLAYGGLQALRRFNPGSIPRVESVQIDGTVLLFTLVIATVTAMLFGMVPAIHAAGMDLVTGLKESSSTASAGVQGKRMRLGLVIAEVALSVAVLAGAGLLIRSFQNLLALDLGFVPDKLLVVPAQVVQLPPEGRAQAVTQITANIARLPGVVAVGAGTGLPPRTAQRGTAFRVDSAPEAPPEERRAYFMAVTPDYFRALGSKIIAGRGFEERDSAGATKVAIINQALARRLFGNQDPLGQTIRLQNPQQSDEPRTIVGIVPEVHYNGVGDDSDAHIYTPFAQTPFLWSYVMVRVNGGGPGIAALHDAARRAAPTAVVGEVKSVGAVVDEAVAQPRFTTMLLASFAGVALILAVIGIYGVISYLVVQRTHEIGVRMALGARRGDVLRLIVGQGTKLALAGIAVGVLLSVYLMDALRSMLFGVTATDPITFVAVAVLLLATALAASYVPARRASKVDPLIALRYE